MSTYKQELNLGSLWQFPIKYIPSIIIAIMEYHHVNEITYILFVHEALWKVKVVYLKNLIQDGVKTISWSTNDLHT